MKTFKFMSMLLASMALCCGLSSCDDDDDDDVINVEQPTEEPVDYSKQLHGRWQYGTSGSSDYRTLGFDIMGVPNYLYFSWTLDSGSRYQGVIAEGKYNVSGDKLTMEFDGDDVFIMEKLNDHTLDNPSSLGDFSMGRSLTMTYTINSCDGTSLVLTDKNGDKFSYIKYKDE